MGGNDPPPPVLPLPPILPLPPLFPPAALLPPDWGLVEGMDAGGNAELPNVERGTEPGVREGGKLGNATGGGP